MSKDNERYTEPEIADYGDLLDITSASGIIGTEDGAGKVVHAGVEGVAEVTVGVFP